MSDLKFSFEGTFPNAPEMPLRAKLGWEYFFESNHPDWGCVHTADGMWIVTDEACDLDNAMIYPNDESFIEWLDSVATENLNDSPVEFLSCFVHIRELVTQEVASAMKKVIEDGSTKTIVEKDKSGGLNHDTGK